MKKHVLFLLLAVAFSGLLAQNAELSTLPEYHIPKSEVETHLRFLASDELQGRYTGSPGNNIAARYIAANLNALGFEPAPGADEGFFQYMYFEKTTAPAKSTLSLHKDDFVYKEDYILMRGEALDVDSRAVFAGYGWVDEENGHDDYADLDVAGKVVFVISGTPESQAPQESFRAISEKMRIAQEKGAAALFEIYRINFPWPMARSYFGGSNMSLAEDESDEASANPMPFGWIKDISDTDVYQRLRDGKKVKVSFSNSGFQKERMRSQNVVGVLEGSDPALKDEYVVISAHYDHVGVGKQGGQPYTEQDSIFNGARDDAMGVSTILTAARVFAQERPRRSILFAAFTGEELGLLGSEYFTQHPLIPLDQIVFNANNDTPGYSDTTIISIFGYGRTGTDLQVEKGLASFGLKVFGDPAPEQNLYDRSDNVSFAKFGIPALTFSPGFTSFDEEINKYYHQAIDNPDSINFDYLQRYAKAYTYTVRLIADSDKRPFWVEGDKYESAGKKLYGPGVDRP